MASISKRGPYQWQVKIHRKGYPVQSKTFATEDDAKKWSRLIESEMDRGVFCSQAEAEKTTLDEALERYLREITPEKKGPSKRRAASTSCANQCLLPATSPQFTERILQNTVTND